MGLPRRVLATIWLGPLEMVYIFRWIEFRDVNDEKGKK